MQACQPRPSPRSARTRPDGQLWGPPWASRPTQAVLWAGCRADSTACCYRRMGSVCAANRRVGAELADVARGPEPSKAGKVQAGASGVLAAVVGVPDASSLTGPGAWGQRLQSQPRCEEWLPRAQPQDVTSSAWCLRCRDTLLLI